MRKMVMFLLVCALFVPVMAQEEEAIRIDFPPPIYDIAGQVPVAGTVNPPDFQSYYLEQAPFDLQNPDAEIYWVPASLPSLTPVVDGVLATWDTTVFPDGLYQLRLRVQLTSGETRFVMVRPLRIANDLERPAGEAPAQAASTATPSIPPTEAPPPTPVIVPRPNPVNQLPLPVGGHVTQFSQTTVDFMNEAGMTWMKWQIPFVVGDGSLVDVARDRVNFAHENGFKVLLSIKGDKDELRNMSDEYYPVFAEFLGRVAGLGPEAIQIWNEQNLDREWPNGRIDPRAYVEMLRQASIAIKAVDPTIMVITGAPAPTGAEGAFGTAAVWNDDRYYQGMANAGVDQYADCIGVHYNEGIVPPGNTGGDPRNYYPTQYLPLMLQRAAAPFRNSDIPLCFSELGYLSRDGYGPLPQSFAWASTTSVEEQAAWLRDAITVAATFESKRVALIIVWNVDFDIYTQDDPQGGYAIIRPDATCPACQTIGSLKQ